METALIDRAVSALDYHETAKDTPYESLAKKEDIDMLDQLLNDIPEREAIVLRLRFGLNDTGGLAWSRIGREFGVTGERIRQLSETALERLRKRWRQALSPDLESER